MGDHHAAFPFTDGSGSPRRISWGSDATGEQSTATEGTFGAGPANPFAAAAPEDAPSGDYNPLAAMFDENPTPREGMTSEFGARAAAAGTPGENLPELWQPPTDDLASMFDDAPASTLESPSDMPSAAAGTVLAARQETDGLVTPFATRQPAVPAAGSLAAKRAAAEKASVSRSDTREAEKRALENRRYQDAQRLEPVVDQILGLGARGGSPELQSFIKRVTLTLDSAEDARQRREYERVITPAMSPAGVVIGNPHDRQAVFDIAYDELVGVGPLGPLWRDPTITEILVDGPNKVTIERQGEPGVQPTDVTYRDLAHLEESARTLAGLSGDDRAVSATNPVPTIHLPRARVQFVWRPVSGCGISIAIRKFGKLHGMADLLQFGSLTDDMAELLSDLVKARATVLISGGVGSGKTTFINALSEFIPSSERVITIEDARELSLRNENVTPLITKEAASADDTIRFDQALLLKTSLRLRPDRIIVGEVRDGEGATAMLEAANTGHDGTMTTVHANNARAALDRMTALVRKGDGMPIDVARAEVSSAVDVVVQVTRRRGRRFVSEIAVVDPSFDGTFAVTPVYVGELGVTDEGPVFRRVGGIGPDTDIADRMLDTGLDPSIWE